MTAKYLRSPSAAVVTEARGKEETIQEQIDDLKKQLASLKRENDKKFGYVQILFVQITLQVVLTVRY